ncbi:MAG: DUF6514 family protein [Clostridia bacterium]|nr:DUF6514 family protein [Clostridia bacterium]
MKNIKYTIIVTTITVEEKEYNSYGIACNDNGKIMKFVEDVSIDEKAVEKLVKLFNRLKLDPVQLEEAIEDALS